MCDGQHPPEALCGPEGLLRQVREAAAARGVPLGGELEYVDVGTISQALLDRRGL